MVRDAGWYENPYQPPLASLAEPVSPPDRPQRRFRFRVIPATLCFLYGGLLVAAIFVVQLGLIAGLALGSSDFPESILASSLLIMVGLAAFSVSVPLRGLVLSCAESGSGQLQRSHWPWELVSASTGRWGCAEMGQPRRSFVES